MSIYGTWTATTIAEGASKSSATDIGNDFDYLSIEIPTTDECKLYLQVSERLDGTYYDLGKETTTNEETFNRADVWRLGGWRFIKMASSVEQTAERLIRVRGMRY